MTNDTTNALILRNTPISTDEQGRVCLDDLWVAARTSSGRKPSYWRLTEGFKALKRVLQKKVGNPDVNGEVVCARRGRGQKGTYAHPILAAAYAGYLDPHLEIEMRDVWLRYRSGDATLADEILQRATQEANHWAGVRALVRSGRRAYTDVLKAHGVKDRGYMECTEAVYLHLLGGRSYQIRSALRLKPKTNLREHLDADKLAYILAAEALSAERIEEEQRQGNKDCVEASALCASAIQKAINDDRKNRQRRLVA